MRFDITTGSTRLAVAAVVLLGAAACDHTPTGIRDVPRPTLDVETAAANGSAADVSNLDEVCYLIDGQIYCIEAAKKRPAGGSGIAP